MPTHYTDREFWIAYWRAKTDLLVSVDKNYTFHKPLATIIKSHSIKTAIELGGFPGYYAIFLKKYFNVSSSLFDFFVDRSILSKVLKKNELTQDAIEIIEADLFNYYSEKKYDLVLSCGLIEHFDDTKDIINRHIQLLNDRGVLFISLPNFTGLNGWIQRKFDMYNFEKHNIRSMDLLLLKKICHDLKLVDVKIEYYGKFTVWLEDVKKKPLMVRFFVKCIWFLGKSLVTLIPFESKLLSPYIILVASKTS